MVKPTKPSDPESAPDLGEQLEKQMPAPRPDDRPESEQPARRSRPVLKRIDGGGGVDEDLALVEAARCGDQRAFSKLFERHHGRVYAMCTRLLSDRAEVEDAVQQTFLEAWRCLHRFEGRSRFTTWLTRIAIHTSLGFRRRVKRLIFSSEVRPEAAVHDIGWGGREHTSPDQGVHERNRKQAMLDILQRLTAKKRVVFVLAELEGMTAPEISEILKIPDATVRTRLFHARKEFAVAARSHPAFADADDGGAS